jgi:hypothetical protein
MQNAIVHRPRPRAASIRSLPTLIHRGEFALASSFISYQSRAKWWLVSPNPPTPASFSPPAMANHRAGVLIWLAVPSLPPPIYSEPPRSNPKAHIEPYPFAGCFAKEPLLFLVLNPWSSGRFKTQILFILIRKSVPGIYNFATNLVLSIKSLL